MRRRRSPQYNGSRFKDCIWRTLVDAHIGNAERAVDSVRTTLGWSPRLNHSMQISSVRIGRHSNGSAPDTCASVDVNSIANSSRARGAERAPRVSVARAVAIELQHAGQRAPTVNDSWLVVAPKPWAVVPPGR